MNWGVIFWLSLEWIFKFEYVWAEQGSRSLPVRLQGHIGSAPLTQIKAPPSSYKATPSRAGGTAAGAGTGRPQSTQGKGFSNKLAEKANELDGTRYRNTLTAKAANPEENFKKL